jgi:hypothetical protein
LKNAGMKFRTKRSSGMAYQHIPAHFDHCLHDQELSHLDLIITYFPSYIVKSTEMSVACTDKSRFYKCFSFMVYVILFSSVV